MANALSHEILSGVDFGPLNERDLPKQALLHQWSGFLIDNRLGPLLDEHSPVQMIGFGVSGWQRGTNEVASFIDPITEFEALPEDKDLRSIDRYGEAVGPRLYNTPLALGGTLEHPVQIGAYVVSLHSRDIYDARRPLGHTLAGRMQGAFVHQTRRLEAKQFGMKSVAERLHRRQEREGQVDAVLKDQTLDAWLKKRKRGIPNSPIPEAFLIIRNPHVIIRRIGIYRRPERGV